MARGKGLYPQGVLINTALEVINEWGSPVFFKKDVIQVIKGRLPKAKHSSINNCVSWYLVKKGVVEKVDKWKFRRLGFTFPKATAVVSPSPKLPEPSEPSSKIPALDIGEGVVELVNKLKAELKDALSRMNIAEEQAVNLTAQINVLQEKCNAMKLKGGLEVVEIFS